MKKRGPFFRYGTYTACLIGAVSANSDSSSSIRDVILPALAEVQAARNSLPDQCTVAATIHHSCIQRRTASESVGGAMLG